MAAMTATNNDNLYLGIDGGGSTCRARLRRHDGQLLGEGTAGPANLRLGLEQAQMQILSCTQQALQQAELAGLALDQLHVGMGLAGAVLSDDSLSTQTLQSLFASCVLHQDAYIACLGAHLGQPGGIVILGTGSCAQIICAESSRTFGGWGLAISDHASGAWLGRLAVSQALQALEQIRPSSGLLDAINAKFGDQATQVLLWSEQAKPADYAQFAPLVFEHAEQHDASALALVNRGCEQLTLLLQRLEQYNTGRISLLGGLAASYLRFLPNAEKTQLCPARTDALDGALLMAGLPVDALASALS